MMEKLFSAKVISVNNYMLSVMLFAFIGGCVVLLLIMLTPIKGEYAGYAFLGVMIIAVIAALFSKEGLSINTSKEKLVVYEDHFEIGQLMFPFIEVINLEFSFTSFLKMKKNVYQPDLEADNRRDVEDGTRNSISFRYKNQTYTYPFLVESQQHFFLFVQMLEELYINKITFSERNWYGKTFMMQNVTEEEYAALLKKYQ